VSGCANDLEAALEVAGNYFSTGPTAIVDSSTFSASGLLSKQGLIVLNDDMTGKTHQDRKLLTRDSPLASNDLGLLAANALLDAI
jgi:hypothetical protein